MQLSLFNQTNTVGSTDAVKNTETGIPVLGLSRLERLKEACPHKKRCPHDKCFEDCVNKPEI